jgi:hypothetical protein
LEEAWVVPEPVWICWEMRQSSSTGIWIPVCLAYSQVTILLYPSLPCLRWRQNCWWSRNVWQSLLISRTYDHTAVFPAFVFSK